MDQLPLLLAGGGHTSQAQMVLPLARPLYFLAPPWRQNLPANCRPIIVGEKKHELALRQWQQAIAQYPGHAALANMLAGREESSWHSLRQQLKGLPEVGLNAHDRRIILFLLQNILDEEQAEQRKLAATLRQANARLLAGLDNQGSAEELVILEEEDSEQANASRLGIWAAMAGQVRLPAAIWVMPRGVFNAWRPPCIAQAALPWPLEWQKEWLDFITHGLRRLRENIDAFPAMAHDLAAQLEEKLQDQAGRINLCCLPGAARRELLGLEHTPDDFICLVG